MYKGWFGPKTVGWGASPKTWQGWLATFLFVAVAAVTARVLAPHVALYLGIRLQIVRIAAVALELSVFLLVIRATYDPDA